MANSADRVHRHWRFAVADAVVVAVSYFVLLFARFEGEIPDASRLTFAVSWPLLAVYHIGCGVLAGNHRRDWRYVSTGEVFHLFAPMLVSSVLLAVAQLAIAQSRPLPVSVVALAWLPIGVGMAAVRLLPHELHHKWLFGRGATGDYRERVLVVGSGRAAHDLIRELERHDRRFVAAGVVSDDPRMQRLQLGSVRVLGRVEQLPQIIEDSAVDVVAIAMPDAARSEVRRVVESCLPTNARIRIVPQLRHALDGEDRPNGLLRLTEAEDFLGREPAKADTASCRSYIAGRRVLITGAAGSIGSELARQIIRLDPEHLLLLDSNESGLFDLEAELRSLQADAPLTCLVRNIEDARCVKATFQLGVEVVFHAAAYKHVPLLESQPEQAIITNVFGTRNLMYAAREAGIQRFVFVSTDKAVMPSNVMGASKRIGEGIVHTLGREAGIQTAIVRFGNVLGSRGSVIPTFERQIARGGPVTVTHPDVTRYFMTIPEAVMLVIQAGALTRDNETFVLHMGEEIRIADLAEKLIRLRGQRVGKDIEIVYTGLRPGEKLAEELTYPEEQLQPTSHPDVFRIEGGASSVRAVESALANFAHAVAEDSYGELRALLLSQAQELFGDPVAQDAAWPHVRA